MPQRALLSILALALVFALDLFAADWVDEAEIEDSVPESVRDATLDFAKTGEYEHTRVIYEGTVERFPFGHREPTLLCAPLRICSIVLEAGEIVLNVVAGDTQHWQTFELSTGPAGATPIVAVRPMVDFAFSDTCDKTTNLVITTDRRIYDVLLELPPCSQQEASDPNPRRPYHRQLRFFYPDDLLRRWHTVAELREIQEQALAQHEPPPPPTRLSGAGVEGLNWDYRVRRDRHLFKRSPRFPWRPQAVFDDGVRTYLKLPSAARELPAVFEVSGGDDVLVNFAVAADDPSLLILPKVAEHLVLVLPRGKKRARLHLVNEAAAP